MTSGRATPVAVLLAWAGYLAAAGWATASGGHVPSAIGVLPVAVTGFLLGARWGVVAGVAEVAVAALAGWMPPLPWQMQVARDGAVVASGLAAAHLGRLLREAQGRSDELAAALQARQESEGRLREAHEKLAAVVAGSPLPIIDLDIDCRVVGWNAAAERTFGWTAQEVVGRPLPVVTPEDRDSFEQHVRLLREGKAIVRRDVLRLCKDGTLIPMDSHVSPRHDPQGNVVGMVAILVDLRDRKRAEEVEARTRELLDNLDEGYFSIDLRHPSRTVVSKGCLLLVGLDSATFREAPWSWTDRLPAPDRRTLDAAWHRASQGGAARATVCLPESGRWVSVSLKARRDATGAVQRIDGSLRDVTMEREAEEQARRVRELEELAAVRSRFLNQAAHELATPLTPIRLQLASLRHRLPGEPRLPLLERNFERLGRLVQDLLDAARLQSGRLRVEMAQVPLAELVAGVRDSFADQAEREGIAITTECDGEPVAFGDRGRIEQVLWNLVHNALKFTPPGGRVQMRAWRGDDGVVVEVRDDGVGLDEQQLGRLFQPFTQVHATTPKPATGSGLGLYIAQAIARQHGGEVEAESSGPGQGATFRLRLPHPPVVQLRQEGMAQAQSVAV
ncbi:MAG TPA: PAS domain-containing sensor histidine kinase, partial [Candidatus Thermoplasmatota archaeon]|nr:PAS domain-containing sensor histidine kinase [Candidatus Thermoplasmatota archaeon]